MKNKFSVIFILLAFMLSISIFKKPFSPTNATNINTETVEKVSVESKSAILIEPFTGTVIYSKNETERLPIASMCKIMTLLLTFEEIDKGNLDLDQEVIVSENAAGMGGSQVFLEKGGAYPLKELVKSIVVASANDASVAVAELICGSESDFTAKMNQKTKDLGMNDTVFVNCTGLPKAGQFSSAKDVSIMFSELIKHKEYFDFSRIWTDEIVHPENRVTQISNTNKLIRFYEGCDGGKTGYTKEAGHCLASTANRNGMRLVSVLISAPDGKTRFHDASSLFNYAFNNFTNKLVVDNRQPLSVKAAVYGGKQSEISVIAQKPVFVFSSKNEKISLEINVKLDENLKAPVKMGDIVGEISVLSLGKEIACVKVLAAESVEKNNYFDYIGEIAQNW